MPRSNIHITFVFLWLLSFYVLPGKAQSDDDAKRPRIGLVLSGGGAKGMAHIGALKVIEESGVKIDFIGGTSMGAIVGGLYASGYSASELDSLFRNTNFQDIIQDNFPRGSKTFYEKADSESASTSTTSPSA